MRWAGRRIRQVPLLAQLLALAGLLWVVYGPGSIGYDSAYALVWGNDLAHGRTPDFHNSTIPTPHPLANLIGAPLSLFGSHAIDIATALTFVAFAALVLAAVDLARTLFGPAVAVLFAVLVATRPLLVDETREAFVDIPFLALLLWAAALYAKRPERRAPILILLGIAGLLRPEAWVFTAVYVAISLPSAKGRDRWLLVAGGLAAPLIWLGADWLIAGDPLYSLHGTQAIAADIGRPRGFGEALRRAPSELESTIGTTVMWIGLAGCLLGLWTMYARSLIPAGILATGLAAFLAIGVARLALIGRYLLAPGVALACFCAVAVLGWTRREGGTLRTVWAAGSIGFLILLGLSGSGTRDQIASFGSGIDARRQVTADLVRLSRQSRVESLLATCRPVWTDQPRAVAMVAYLGHVPLRSVLLLFTAHPAGLAFLPAEHAVATAYEIGGEVRGAVSPAQLPHGYRKLAADRSWAVYGRC